MFVREWPLVLWFFFRHFSLFNGYFRVRDLVREKHTRGVKFSSFFARDDDRLLLQPFIGRIFFCGSGLERRVVGQKQLTNDGLAIFHVEIDGVIVPWSRKTRDYTMSSWLIVLAGRAAAVL